MKTRVYGESPLTTKSPTTHITISHTSQGCPRALACDWAVKTRARRRRPTLSQLSGDTAHQICQRRRAREGGQGTSPATYRHPLGASSEDLVRHCLRLHLRDAVDLLELLEELGFGRVARLLPWAEGVERDLVGVGVRVGRVWSKY